jgi:CheY-like chemotaxis protein
MPLTSRGTIVVVERSAAAQELIEHALREAGHRVLVTRNPLEALELGRRIRIDALVADVAALDEDGPGLVPQLRAIQPSLPVLYLADRRRRDGDDADTEGTPCPSRSRSTSFRKRLQPPWMVGEAPRRMRFSCLHV